MTQGRLADLRQSDAVIVDNVSINGKFAHILPDGRRESLKIGDTMELNDHRAVVAGGLTRKSPLRFRTESFTTH